MSFAYQKWEATGNDFVMVDLALEGDLRSRFDSDLARRLCDRETGVGADGVVLYEKPPEGPTQVEIWNADGSLAQMCGNALRCVCRALTREEESLAIVIAGRTVKGSISGHHRASIDMGPVGPVGPRPVFESVDEFDHLLGARGYLCSFGNPHYVVPVPSVPARWQDLGQALQPLAHQVLGTGGINCGFLATEPENGEYQLCVYERGVGFTKSCGSGACAASAVLEFCLEIPPPHSLRLPGGRLGIGREGSHFLLEGPARKEFEGSWQE